MTPKPATSTEEAGLSTRRIEAFSDGVFAIVITLMAFQIKAPDPTATELSGVLTAELLQLGPIFYSYVLSFLMVGVYWIGHHNAYHHIIRTNRTLLWLNLVSLMLVALLPFSTFLLGNHWASQPAVVVYSLNIILIGLANFSQWFYATRIAHLAEPNLEDWFVKSADRRLMLGPAISLIAIFISFLNVPAAALCFALILIFHMMPATIDRHSRKKKKNQENIK